MLLFIILQMIVSDWIRTLSESDVITLLESESNIAVKFHVIILNKTKYGLTNKLLGIDNQQIKTASSVKLLGIQLDNKLNFNYHISNICTSVVSQSNALIRI